MQYIAVNKAGEPITTTRAASKTEARNVLQRNDLLLYRTYRKEWRIIGDYGAQYRIEKGILKACFSYYNDK